MSINSQKLLENFPNLFVEIHGNKNSSFVDIAPSESGKTNSLVFISNPKHLEGALNSPASILALPQNLYEKAKDSNTQKTLIKCTNVQLAWALTTQKFFPYDPRLKEFQHQIHNSASVHESAKIASSAMIEAHVVIGKNVTIGENTWIGANSVIEEGVQIGNDCKIFPLVYIGDRCQIGNDVEIKPNCTIGSEGYGYAHDEKGQHYRIPQRGIVVLEDHVAIGANCTIDRATFDETRICEGTKMDNMIHVAHNCKIGKHGLFAGGTVFAGSTEVGNHNMYGGHCSISGHIKIGDHVIIGGRSAVIKNLDKPGAYGGYPLQPLKDYYRTTASLLHLTELRKQVQKILKHLKLDD